MPIGQRQAKARLVRGDTENSPIQMAAAVCPAMKAMPRPVILTQVVAGALDLELAIGDASGIASDNGPNIFQVIEIGRQVIRAQHQWMRNPLKAQVLKCCTIGQKIGAQCAMLQANALHRRARGKVTKKADALVWDHDRIT